MQYFDAKTKSIVHAHSCSSFEFSWIHNRKRIGQFSLKLKMSKHCKKSYRFNKAYLEQAVARASPLKHRQANQVLMKRPTYDLGYVFDHLFSRKRDDETEMIEESMFVPKIDNGHKTSEEERRREESLTLISNRYLNDFGTNLIDHFTLYSACLRTIARNFHSFDSQELEGVIAFLPPEYSQAFHYYCVVHNALDDFEFEQTVVAAMETVIFPATVSGNSIDKVAKKLLSIGKSQETLLDWEELDSLEIFDTRQSTSQILFFGTELETFHFQEISINFANLQFLHFVRVPLSHNDIRAWADDTVVEELEASHQYFLITSFADTSFRSLKEVNFVCCTFVNNDFLTYFSTKILENFISLQLIRVITPTNEIEDLGAREKQKLTQMFLKYNVELSFCNNG